MKKLPKSQMSKKAQAAKGDLSVMDKHSFLIVFKKDIRKLYIYKKSTRLVRAVHAVLPALASHDVLKDKMESICAEIVDVRTHLLPDAYRTVVSDLLTLIEVLEVMSRTGKLSEMNASIITREVETLVEEIGVYEGPRIVLEDVPSLADVAKVEVGPARTLAQNAAQKKERKQSVSVSDKGQKKQTSVSSTQLPVGNAISTSTSGSSSRGEAILEILRSKGPSFIKDISTLFTDVSEKTIQRELASLVDAGKISKKGERRWTVYTVVSD